LIFGNGTLDDLKSRLLLQEKKKKSYWETKNEEKIMSMKKFYEALFLNIVQILSE
jgi:hypothetical protein